MQLLTSLILSATVIIGTFHTMTVSAMPYNSAKTYSSSLSNNHTSLKRPKGDTGGFTNLHQSTKRMLKKPDDPPEEYTTGQYVDWLMAWEEYVRKKMAEDKVYASQGPPKKANRVERMQWIRLKKKESRHLP
ncbi:hypothetical protein BC835DRAFT_1398026 [Cytidiella melzeri]|nr:hypothetical protein BC835DRAFT_1398026 [Cytidiella melzeri]